MVELSKPARTCLMSNIQVEQEAKMLKECMSKVHHGGAWQGSKKMINVKTQVELELKTLR